jgi:putative oxidoreductase
MSIGRLLLRVIVGGYFIGHGTQKLFGWFGGGGLASTAESFDKLGLRPGRWNALAAGIAESGGGAAVVLGAETPVAAAALIATMLTAIRTVHLKHGPWLSNHGYEYNLVLIAAVTALAEVGPGDPSLDAAAGREHHGPGWALAALAGGVAGYIAVEVLAKCGVDAPTKASASKSEADA